VGLLPVLSFDGLPAHSFLLQGESEVEVEVERRRRRK